MIEREISGCFIFSEAETACFVFIILYTHKSRFPCLALAQGHDVHSPTQEAMCESERRVVVFHFSTSEIDTIASCAASRISIDCMQGHGTAQQV